MGGGSRRRQRSKGDSENSHPEFPLQVLTPHELAPCYLGFPDRNALFFFRGKLVRVVLKVDSVEQPLSVVE